MEILKLAPLLYPMLKGTNNITFKLLVHVKPLLLYQNYEDPISNEKISLPTLLQHGMSMMIVDLGNVCQLELSDSATIIITI